LNLSGAELKELLVQTVDDQVYDITSLKDSVFVVKSLVRVIYDQIDPSLGKVPISKSKFVDEDVGHGPNI
jgi:hypothetical protein